jgi:hypothetical protein
MNNLTIEQQLAALENRIEQERLAKALAEPQKRAAINAEYDERVARYKQQIINSMLATKRHSTPVFSYKENTEFTCEPGEEKLILLDSENESLGLTDCELITEELRRKIDAL